MQNNKCLLGVIDTYSKFILKNERCRHHFEMELAPWSTAAAALEEWEEGLCLSSKERRKYQQPAAAQWAVSPGKVILLLQSAPVSPSTALFLQPSCLQQNNTHISRLILIDSSSRLVPGVAACLCDIWMRIREKKGHIRRGWEWLSFYVDNTFIIFCTSCFGIFMQIVCTSHNAKTFFLSVPNSYFYLLFLNFSPSSLSHRPFLKSHKPPSSFQFKMRCAGISVKFSFYLVTALMEVCMVEDKEFSSVFPLLVTTENKICLNVNESGFVRHYCHLLIMNTC